MQKKTENSFVKAHNFDLDNLDFFEKNAKKCSKFKYPAQSRSFWLKEKQAR